MSTKDPREKVSRMLHRIYHQTIQQYRRYHNKNTHIFDSHHIWYCFNTMMQQYLDALDLSYNIAQNSFDGLLYDPSRVAVNNQHLHTHKQNTQKHFPQSANVRVMGGISFDYAIWSIRYPAYVESGPIIDMFSTASSVTCGAHNPCLSICDIHDISMRNHDNICTPYHLSPRHEYILKTIASYHPAYLKDENFIVQINSSWSVSNSYAIESAKAFYNKRNPWWKGKILAVDGTRAGQHTARQATGFGVDQQDNSVHGTWSYVQRALPLPITKNIDTYKDLIEQKLQQWDIAGFIIEPDVIWDAWMYKVNKDILLFIKKTAQKHALPIILDCVQQLWRSWWYFWENVALFSDYIYTIITTAKSVANGQPLSYYIMHKDIADAAHPYSQANTHQMSWTLSRIIMMHDIINDDEYQHMIQEKTKIIESVFASYWYSIDDNGLRWKYLNRSIFVWDNDMVKRTQLALYLCDGLLIGWIPQSLRYQPMIFDYNKTLEKTAHTICKRLTLLQAWYYHEDPQKNKTIETTYKLMYENGMWTGLSL